ncbi:MAG TPA: hypothetical protein VMS87_00500 [Roseiarcus sp.]|nr:hypothetical protein [Roseiarcus sp.]
MAGLVRQVAVMSRFLAPFSTREGALPLAAMADYQNLAGNLLRQKRFRPALAF